MMQMSDYVLAILLNFKLNLLISGLCLTVYFVNYFALKLKREYKGIHYQMFLILTLAPCFNLIFLIFNSILFCTRASGYKVIKIKRKSHARAGRTVKA